MPVTAQLVEQEASDHRLDEAADFSSTVAVRGHDDIQGNLEQLLRLRAEDYPALAGW